MITSVQLCQLHRMKCVSNVTAKEFWILHKGNTTEETQRLFINATLMKNVIKQITHGNRNTKFLFDVINDEIPRGCEIADGVINFSVCCRDVFRSLKSRTWSFEQTEQKSVGVRWARSRFLE